MGQLENISTFVRIVEAGGISKAAEQLNIAKSAISRRLVDLESSVGVQLLNRSTRRSSLTEAGQSYYERALQILADVNELNAIASSAKAKLQGGLKIAAPLSFGLLHLAPAINDFAEKHPELQIHLDFADRQVDLIEEGFDLAIRLADLSDSSLMARKFTTIHRVLCASPSYLARARSPTEPADLKTLDILRYSNDPLSWKFLGPDGVETRVNLTYKMSANNADYLCEAAMAGLGLTILPTFVVWRQLKQGSLIRVMSDYALPSVNAYAVYPQTRYLSLRVRTLIDFLTQRFHGEPYWDRGVIG